MMNTGAVVSMDLRYLQTFKEIIRQAVFLRRRRNWPIPNQPLLFMWRSWKRSWTLHCLKKRGGGWC